jgi:cell cycle arrest protein BUB3
MVDANVALPPEAVALDDPPTDGITCLQYLGRQPLLVSTSWDGYVRVHDTSTRSRMLIQNMNSGPLLSLTTFRRGDIDTATSTQQQLPQQPSHVITGGCDGTIRKLDITTSQVTLVGKHSTNDSNNNSVACSCLSSTDDEHLIVSAGWHQQLHVWDTRVSTSALLQPISTIQLPGKAFSMDIDPKKKNLIAVATSGRRTCFIDLRHTKNSSVELDYGGLDLVLDRESSLKYQTRCIRFIPDGDAIVVGSIEGRAAVEYLDDLGRTAKGKKFAFKCHRVGDMVYPVNAIECHPLYGTFATGGCDGTVGTFSSTRHHFWFRGTIFV